MATSHHHLIRPPATATNVEVWNGSRWVTDDGISGVAFSGLSGRVPLAFYPACACDHGRPGSVCPSEMAMRRTVERFGAGNGVAL